MSPRQLCRAIFFISLYRQTSEPSGLHCGFFFGNPKGGEDNRLDLSDKLAHMANDERSQAGPRAHE